MILRSEDKKMGGAVRRLVPVVAVIAVAGAAAISLTNTSVSAAEPHGVPPTATIEAIDGVQVAQDAAAGATAFIRCRVCHTVERGEPNRVGPNLFGVVGRNAGTVAAFMYSDQMKGSNINWTEAYLDKYIQDPPGTVPGNRMQLAKGAINPQQTKDIIAFLKTKM